MAMINYGAIVLKNDRLISTDMFTPMIDMVDWADTKEDVYHDYVSEMNKVVEKPLELNNNYFAYAGDKDCTIAFYKEQIVIVKRYKDGTFSYKKVFFNNTDFVWTKWEHIVWVKGEPSKIKITKKNGYYVCRWKYKNDKYKIYFGYGVDVFLYKKYRLVNYYRSPVYALNKVKNWCWKGRR